jgi:hypothetical protein
MHADLLDLPALHHDVYLAMAQLDEDIAQLVRAREDGDSDDVARQLDDNRAVLSALRDVYHARPYFDKIDYCERLINYLVAYACKGEMSATEASSMFRSLAASDLPDDTPVMSLARKLAFRVLKARECPRTEIAHMLQGLPLYRASQQVPTLPVAAAPLPHSRFPSSQCTSTSVSKLAPWNIPTTPVRPLPTAPLFD